MRITTTYQCIQSDTDSLHQLYTDLSGEFWTWTNLFGSKPWNFTGNNVNPCDNWSGITCEVLSSHGDQSGATQPSYISFISLQDKNLSGSIPEYMNNFTNLHYIVISNNPLLSGTIPRSFCNISNLYSLYLENNDLSGTIPSCLFRNLHDLQVAILNHNRLHGTIPEFSEFGGSFYVLSLENNYLSGSLPSSMKYLTRVGDIILNDNQLTGSIEILEYCLDLYTLVLNHNSFSGNISDDFFVNLSYMTELSLDANDFTGRIPSSLYNLDKLEYISIFDNYFTGSISDDISNLKALTRVGLNTNLFTGSIPASIGDLPFTSQIDLYNNYFSGTLPASIRNLEYLSVFFVQNNLLSGTLDHVFNSTFQEVLSSINLADNHFTGRIPTEEIFSSSLEIFIVYNNCFDNSDHISEDICRAEKLTALILNGLRAYCAKNIWPSYLISSNKSPKINKVITGTIPRCIYNLPLLKTLHVAGNGIQDRIPDLSSFHNLQDIDLSYNALTGTIPKALQQHTKLIRLNLVGNRLQGEIHRMSSFDETSQSNRTTTLKLSTNRLSGIIPESIEQVDSINILAGNVFSCSKRHPPPDRDVNSDNYVCGSDDVNSSMLIIFPIIGFFLLLLIAVVARLFYIEYRANRRRKSSSEQIESVVSERPEDVEETVNPIINNTDTTTSNHQDDSIAVNGNYTMHDQLQLVCAFLNDTSNIRLFEQRVSALRSQPSSNLLTNVYIIFYEVLLWRLTYFSTLDTYAQRFKSLGQFQRSLDTLSRIALYVTSIEMTLFIAVYLLLKRYFKTFSNQYSYLLSGIFMSGYVSAIAVIVLWLLVVLTSVYCIVRYVPQKQHPVTLTDSAKSRRDHPIQHYMNYWTSSSTQRSILTFIVNCLIVTTIKGVLIYNILYYHASFKVKFLFTVLLSLTDITWSSMLVPTVINRVLFHLSSTSKMKLKLFTLYFNSILAPSLAVILTNDSCFKGIFIKADESTYTYDVDYCFYYSQDHIRCQQYYKDQVSISYTPSFAYNYNCYSAVVADYTPIFMISYAFMALFVPLFSLYLVYHQQSNSALQMIFPLVYFPNTDTANTTSSTLEVGAEEGGDASMARGEQAASNGSNGLKAAPSNDSAMSGDQASTSNGGFDRLLFPGFIFASQLHYLMALLTFGLVFPPLSVVVLIASVVTRATWQVLIGRWIHHHISSNNDSNSDGSDAYMRGLQRLDKVCSNVCISPRRCTHVIIFGSAVFIALISLDLAGDQLGLEKSLWTVGSVVLLSLLLYFLSESRSISSYICEAPLIDARPTTSQQHSPDCNTTQSPVPVLSTSSTVSLSRRSSLNRSTNSTCDKDNTNRESTTSIYPRRSSLLLSQKDRNSLAIYSNDPMNDNSFAEVL